MHAPVDGQVECHAASSASRIVAGGDRGLSHFFDSWRVTAHAIPAPSVLRDRDPASQHPERTVRRNQEKIGEAAKKAGEPTDSTPKPAEGAPPPKAPATTAPSNEPNVIPITDTSLTALERGLQTEITLRAAYKKELEDQAARAKQYEACSNQANTSPEMMAVSAEVRERIRQREDTGRHDQGTARIAAEHDAVVASKCGQAPPKPAATDDRLTDIMRKAAADAGPIQ
jgi:hypothetical protein